MTVINQTYYIHHFDMFPAKEGKWFTYLPSGFCELVTQQDQYWLEWLSPFKGQILSERRCGDFVQQCPLECREALMELGLVKSVDIHSPLQKGIQVLTDVPEKIRPFISALRGSIEDDFLVCSRSDELAANLGLTFVYYDHYQEGRFRELMKVAPGISDIIQCSYRLDQHFFIDNPYLPQIANPDHFSCRENLQRSHGYSKDRQGIYGLLDFCTNQCPAVVPAVSLGEIEYSFISWLLFQQYRKIMGIAEEIFRPDTVNLALSVDLIRSRVIQTPVTHYEYYLSE